MIKTMWKCLILVCTIFCIFFKEKRTKYYLKSLSNCSELFYTYVDYITMSMNLNQSSLIIYTNNFNPFSPSPSPLIAYRHIYYVVTQYT